MGITGSGLRATGFDWDYRKKRPIQVLKNLNLDIPLGKMVTVTTGLLYGWRK